MDNKSSSPTTSGASYVHTSYHSSGSVNQDSVGGSGQTGHVHDKGTEKEKEFLTRDGKKFVKNGYGQYEEEK